MDDLGFEGLWIIGSLAHGETLAGLKMVPALSGHHRSKRQDQEGELAGR